MRKVLVVGAVLGMALAWAGPAQASPVAEIEPDDSIATAQNIDGFFSLDFSPVIGDVANTNTSTIIPLATVSGTGNGAFDHYSFTVSSTRVAIFDIDYGMVSLSTPNNTSYTDRRVPITGAVSGPAGKEQLDFKISTVGTGRLQRDGDKLAGEDIGNARSAIKLERAGQQERR